MTGPEQPPDEPADTGAADLVGASEPTLADLLDDLAGEFPDVERLPGPDATDFVVGTMPFARLRGRTAEFRLRPEIVAAAARTGDASESALGREWVAFSPTTFDQYAVDRAQSWFELGHRLAAQASRTRPAPSH